jgi:putative sugar O-methyltransferase
VKTFTFNDEFVGRYKQFLVSEEYSHESDNSKSQYWKYFADQVGVEINGSSITVKAKSGFYIPQKRGFLNRLNGAAKKLITEPGRVFQYLVNKFVLQLSGANFISYGEAFNKVLRFGQEPRPVSKYKINFSEVAKKNNAYVSLQDIKGRMSSHYTANNQVIYSHYVYNILNEYADLISPKRILEIGAGNGNLLSVMYDNVGGSCIIDVDLPETLSHAILYISELYPKAKILMPHEAEGKQFDNYDFVFLTPSQIELIENDSVDISINTFSFQEMTHPQIKDYFDLVQRCGKKASLFFTSNRVEKMPYANLGSNEDCDELPNRFSEYPWSETNEVLAYEICSLMQQVQFHSVFIRLEQVGKP